MKKQFIPRMRRAKAPLFAAVSAALCLISAQASADYSNSVTVSSTTELPGSSYALSAENGSYTADMTIEGGSYGSYFLATFGDSNLEEDSDGIFHFDSMHLTMSGDIATLSSASVYTGGLYIRYWHSGIVNQMTFNIDSYYVDSNLTLKGGHINPNALAAINDDNCTPVTVNVGDLWIRSIVNVDSEWQDNATVANNGVYAAGSGMVINLNGDTYVNTILVNGLEEAYSTDYGPGMSKNDALSAKYGGTVNVNLEGGHTVQLLGNLDARQGTMTVNLDDSESYWHGHGTNLSSESDLTVMLSNGAQWVPDLPIEVMQNLVVSDGGIVNLHGFNLHTNTAGLTQQLSIENLTGDGGIFIMDLTASNESGPIEEPTYTHTAANGTWDGEGITREAVEGRNDFLYVKSGSGSFSVLPVDSTKLNGVSYDNPIWFADVPTTVTFTAYTEVTELSDGFVYDYTPLLDTNVVATDENKNGTNWYIVGLQKDLTDASEVAISDAALNFAAATSFLELDSLNKRLGEVRRYGDDAAGLWVRAKAGRMTSDTNGSFRSNYQFYQLGADYAYRPANGSGTYLFGAALHTANHDAKFTAGSGDVDTAGASLYATWYNDKGFYADLIARYSHLKDEYKVVSRGETAKASYSDDVWSVSAEGGKRFELGAGFSLEPELQLVYTHLSGASYTLSNGIRVDQGSADSLIGRAGVRLGRDFRFAEDLAPSKVYLKANVYREFSGDRSVMLTGSDDVYTQDADAGDTWFTYGIGADFTIRKNVFFYADVEKSAGGDVDTKWQVNAGFRWAF
ncbi:MAG: autotransporter outer membrane beta-barrel domain-containing protein [Burkholderia sp.]|jgi:outer membrane autotransporter protein